MKFPGVTPAVLSVELISLDTATRTISARLSLIFTGNLVSHLQFSSVSYPGLVPLTKVPAHVWAKLPVDIRLISCGRVKRSGSCPPIASIPLGQLDPYGRGGSESVQTAVTLPIIGWPDRFPSDTYVLTTTPEVLFPNNVSLITRAASSPASPGHGPSAVVPAKTVITADSGLGGHTLTVVEGSSRTRPLVVGLLIGRPILYRITIYLVALLPLLLGAVVVHASAVKKTTSGPEFDPVVIGGLIVAMLAILPLRAVLVPSDINAAGLTLVDYILVLDFLFIAAAVFYQYARFVTARRDA